MLRTVLISFLLLVFASNLQADNTEQLNLDFSKAWYKPALIENNDTECSGILKDAQDKFFSSTSFGAAYGIQGYGYSKTGTILDWTVVTGETRGQLEAYGKTFYLDYINNHGCGGACETNQPLVSDKPFPEKRDYAYLEELAADAPPAASYGYTIVETPKKMFYLFIVGSSEEYKNQLLIYKLAPEARWKSACKISLAPEDIKQIEDPDLSSAVTSVNDLNQSVVPIFGDAGSCGTSAAHYLSKRYMLDAMEQALYRPWALTMSQDYPSANSYGDYKRISQQLEMWSLAGISEYQALLSYKTQLEKSTSDISAFYQKKYGWSEQQSKAMAEEALTSAISRGFGFYMYDPQFATGEEDLRKAVLAKKNINEIKAIQFDVKNIDSPTTRWSGGPESYESILNIAVGYPDALKFLLDKGVAPDKANGFGKTALMYAAQHNRVDSARILIDHESNTVAATTRPNNTCYYTLQTFGMTPLHYAVRYASPDFIKLLLDHGAATFMKAENHHKYPMVEETPLDWFHRYTAADSSEKNPNIPDDKIAEVEKWLQPPGAEELAVKAQDYVLTAEKAYQKGETQVAYRNLIKAVEIQPDNERVLSDMSLVALKNGDLGVSLEAGDKLIKKSSDSKLKANAWFNQGLACEKHKSSGVNGGLSYNSQYYCQQSIVYPYLQSWVMEQSSSRSNKLQELFKKDAVDACEITPSDGETYKLHFARVDNKQKIYVYHSKKHNMDASEIHWDIKFFDPKTNTSKEPTRFIPVSVASYDLGDYVIDEMESQQGIQYPVAVGNLTCRSGKSKDFGAGTAHTELHIVGINTASDKDVVIDIQPNKNPIILFLSAYNETNWLIKNQHGVKIEKIILGGYNRQSATGIDQKIPIEKYVKIGAKCEPTCSEGRDYFYSSKVPAAQIEEITGLVPTSFQYMYSGKEFRVPRTDKMIHVITLRQGDTIHINVMPTNKPLTLALSSDAKTEWVLEGEGVSHVERVMLGGAEAQRVTGLPSSVPIDKEAHNFRNYSEDSFAKEFGVVPQSIQNFRDVPKVMYNVRSANPTIQKAPVIVSPINKGHYSYDD